MGLLAGACKITEHLSINSWQQSTRALEATLQAHIKDTQILLEQAAVGIYSRLLSSQEASDGEALQMIAEGSACIWAGSGFVVASRVVFQLPEKLEPWLYSVPSCLQPCKALLQSLGVQFLHASLESVCCSSTETLIFFRPRHRG